MNTHTHTNEWPTDRMNAQKIRVSLQASVICIEWGKCDGVTKINAYMHSSDWLVLNDADSLNTFTYSISIGSNLFIRLS